MQFQVYRQTRWLKKWLLCGEFENFTAAYEYVKSLLNSFPRGATVKFRIITL